MSNSSFPKAEMHVGDGAHVDAFSRLRTSHPIELFGHKNIHNRGASLFSELTSGSLSSIAHLPGQASVELTCGTEANAYALRQTTRYIPYVPGKSQYVLMTFDFDDARDGVVNEIGYGDDDNGILLVRNGSTISFVIRSSVTGTVIENSIDKANWNVDRLDGSRSSKNRSGFTLDLTKTNILVIDFQWLGVGRVRCGFDIDGQIIICHEFNNAGTLDTVYMGTPSLPVRYKIYNTSLQTTSTAMREICCAVSSEGGYTPPGTELSAGHLITSRRAVTTRIPVFAIRLKNQFSATVTKNRKTIRFLNVGLSTTTNNALFEIAHVHSPSSITATWIDRGAYSAIEYSRDISAVTGNPEHVFEQEYTPTGQANKASVGTLTSESINEHSFISQNFDSTNSDMFVVYATAETGTADVLVHMTWIEID